MDPGQPPGDEALVLGSRHVRPSTVVVEPAETRGPGLFLEPSAESKNSANRSLPVSEDMDHVVTTAQGASVWLRNFYFRRDDDKLGRQQKNQDSETSGNCLR